MGCRLKRRKKYMKNADSTGFRLKMEAEYKKKEG
jgi:hypothetical protein